MLGSTLHRGANCAQARRAGEVDGGVVVALVLRLAGLAAPVLRPANVLDVPTDMARLGGGKETVGLHQCAPVPGALVAELPPRFPEGCVGEPPPARSRAGEALLSQHPCRVQVLDNDHAVGLGELGGEVVDGVLPDRRHLGVKAGELPCRFPVA